MSPEAQSAAIAEACGWINQGKSKGVPALANRWLKPGTKNDFGPAPDYLTDLNALHEAVEGLRNNQFHAVDYPRQLFKVVTGLEWTGDMGYFFFNLVNATCGERAEAFLRTIGKWTDETKD